jgi:predicted GIY-YIG superfamily endonuclease
MEHLYILELTCGKYFVGKSRNVEHTYAYYECGFGPKWIQTYNPVRIVETRPITGDKDVLNATLALMKTHGLDSVRHYGCGEMRLPDEEERAIRFLMHAPSDACAKCHATGHTVEACTQPENTSWACQWCVSDYPNRYACEQHEKGCRPPKAEVKAHDWCTRCGRLYHTANRCFEVKHSEGWWLKTDS